MLKIVEEIRADLDSLLETTVARRKLEAAADEAPADTLARKLSDLQRTWSDRLDSGSAKLAEHFSKKVSARTAEGLSRALRDAGISIPGRTYHRSEETLRAIIQQNVSLIKSIGADYFSEIEGAVMRSVSVGGDLKVLTDHLMQSYGATRRRAELIARDQNSKATSAMNRANQLDAGFRRAVWVHSSAGKVPRQDHVAFASGRDGGPTYDLDKGAYISGEWIHPGQLINCRCYSRPVLEGYNA